MGSLAAGGAATMGSGAFNVARADRGFNVEFADDTDAYLGLDAGVSEYAEQTGSTLEVGFDGRLGQNGEGLGRNSNYVFTDVFRIINKGTDDINVTLSEKLDDITWETEFPRAFWSYDEIGTTNDVNGDGDFTGATAGDGATIAPGDDLYVHFEFVGRDADLDNGRDDLPEVLGVYAEATN